MNPIHSMQGRLCTVKRLLFLLTLGIAVMAMSGFFGCSEGDDKLAGDDPTDTLGTGTNPPTVQFELAGEIMEYTATGAGQTHLEVGMALVGELMASPAPPQGSHRMAARDGGPSVLLDSSYIDGDWFVCSYSATIADFEDTFIVAGVDSIRFDDGSGGYTTSPDTNVSGFDLRSHVDGTVDGAGGGGDIASHGQLDFVGSMGGVMTINAGSYDTLSYEDIESTCLYTVTVHSQWTNLQFDLNAGESPTSGGLSVDANIWSSCDPGTPDSLQVSGGWTLAMLFDGSTETITVGDGDQEWTYTRDRDGGDPSDTTWPGDTIGDTTNPGDTVGDTTNPGDTIGDTTGDTTVVDYCQPPYTSQETLDSMKLWAFEETASPADDAAITQVAQITLEALQTIDTSLANAFPFASPLLDPQQATVTWDAGLEAYIVDYDMQMSMVDSFYNNDTLYEYSEEISVVGSDTVKIYDGASVVSLPSTNIDSITMRNGYYGVFVSNSTDTTQEWSRQRMRLSFTSLDSTATITLRGTAGNQIYEKQQMSSPDSTYQCTVQYNVDVTVLNVAVDYWLFLDMEDGPGCPTAGSILATAQINQACVGDWYCNVDITGNWDQNESFTANGVSTTTSYSADGLTWNFTDDCSGGSPSPMFGSHRSRR